MQTATVRPKQYFMAQFNNWKCLVEFKPQHKWTLEITSEGKYMVSRDNVTVNFSKEEFEKHFREVEQQ